MAVDNPNPYAPSSAVELSLNDDVATLPPPAEGAQRWDADAQTSLTANTDGQTFPDLPPLRGTGQVPAAKASALPAASKRRGRHAKGLPALNLTPSATRIVYLCLGALGLATAAWLPIVYLDLNPDDAIEAMMEALPRFDGSTPQTTQPDRPDNAPNALTLASTKPHKPEVAPEVIHGSRAAATDPGTGESATVQTSDDRIKEPAYRYIPVTLPPVEAMTRVWSAQEDESWRAGVTHRFTWQRYKTVMDVRAARLLQSTVILWDALADRKFWIRMRAVMGLAEFGIPVSTNNIVMALANTPVATQVNFFRRFDHAGPGERYVMKKTLGLVATPVRQEILAKLKRVNDESFPLYLVAATEESSSRIRAWAKTSLASYPILTQKTLRGEFARLKTLPPTREIDVGADVTELETPDVVPQQRVPVDSIEVYEDKKEVAAPTEAAEQYDVHLE